MLAVQARLPLVRPMQARMRRVRRSFHPSQGQGPYRLPREIHEGLAAALIPYRNRDAAFALAIFLARFWSTPSRIIDAFPIDRRELANRPDLGLTEKRVRSAIRTLEEIGFLDRATVTGSRYKATEDGLRRKPILFMFGSAYAHAFITANKRAAAAQERSSGVRRSQIPASRRRASTVNSEPHMLKRPKSMNPSERTVLMGPLVKESGLPAQAFDPDPKLEAALARLEEGFRRCRGG